MTAYAGSLRIWDGANWVVRPLHARNGGWIKRPVRAYVGGSWILIQSWVDPSGPASSTLTCNTAGAAHIADTSFTGVWEFDFSKPNTASFVITFVCTSPDPSTDGALRVDLDGDELFRLVETLEGILFSTTTGYTANDTTWYRVRIERNTTLNQYFTGAIKDVRVLIKGGAFGSDFVVVSVASGANPATPANVLTSSADFIIEAEAGVAIRDIDINGVRKNAGDFTVDSGSFTAS
jgi:hypothetical protein